MFFYDGTKVLKNLIVTRYVHSLGVSVLIHYNYVFEGG